MSGETEKIWYIFDKGVVSGPFEPGEVKELAGGQFSDGMIWKRGQTEWQSVKGWRGFTHNSRDGLISKQTQNPKDANRPQTQNWNDTWYISSNGFNSGPYKLEELCKKIVSNELPLQLKVWTLGLKKWIDIFEASDVTEVLGIPPRKHLRAPFVGEVKIQGLFKRRAAVAQTISMGGIGLSGLDSIREGAKVNVIVQSDLLREPVKARAKVVYQFQNEGGTTVGLEFIDLDQETQDVVADYIQQFEKK